MVLPTKPANRMFRDVSNENILNRIGTDANDKKRNSLNSWEA